MKKFVFLCFFCAINFSFLCAQPLFVENFNYPPKDTLDVIGGWDVSGTNTSYITKVISPGLVYSGYLGSGIGNCAYLYNKGEGSISLNNFEPVDNGRIYMAFLIRVDSLTTGMQQGYQIAFDQSGPPTNINTKPMIKRLTNTTFNFGIKKSDSAAVYSSTVYNANTTYLVIIKYTFVPGDFNDSAKIFVGTSGIPATEPAAPLASQTAGYDVPDIGEVVVSNSFAQFGGYGISVKVDGIRIGTTWNDVLFTQRNVKYYAGMLIQGFYNNVTNKMVKDTARVILRYNASPYLIADSSKSVVDSLGAGIFDFTRVGNKAPYYIVLRHRNSIETWSAVPKFFELDSLNFDFTFGTYTAFGGNLIQKGTRFCVYNGDVNQEGFVDLTDILIIYNNANNFVSGYVPSDINGDNYVDLTDLVIAFNNSMNFVQAIKP